jgi:alpha-N-arabinofuranosidase
MRPFLENRRMRSLLLTAWLLLQCVLAMAGTYRNPVIPGFAPDPSITRVGLDYYLVTSTFEYFPGIPVYHSRDLVNWSLIGHALADPRSAGLAQVESSGGVQAPTIRHHAGVFYVVSTSIVDGKAVSFIVTATDAKGPWSAPKVLEDAVGIDPSLFFDDDGRVWYTANWLPPDPQFPGQAEIWLQELDLSRFKLIGQRHFLWRGCCQGEWAEAPHLFKKDGRYVLLIAEGGTSYEHAVAVAVSKSVTGPYRSSPRNPALTHRHLSYDHPITSVGHADLVELPDGRWYAVVLGTRRLKGEHATLGRETFLVPVTWETEREWWKEDKRTFPVFSPASGKVELQDTLPLPSTRQRLATQFHDDFRAPTLHPEWTFRRSHDVPFHSLAARQGVLRMALQPAAVAEKARYSFVGIRQRHLAFTASVRLDFVPAGAEEAGLLLIQKDTAAFALTRARDAGGKTVLRVSRFGDDGRAVLAEQAVAPGAGLLRVRGDGLNYRFEQSADGRRWLPVGPLMDGTQLSPAVLKGFNYTGVFVGLYASSNGRPSAAHADFSRWRYNGRPEEVNSRKILLWHPAAHTSGATSLPPATAAAGHRANRGQPPPPARASSGPGSA